MRANRVGGVSVSNCLTRFAKTHWLGHHPQGVNLNRKMWHSAIRKMQGTDEAFKALYKIDKHATLTGKTVHCPTAPEGRRSDRVPLVPVLVQRSCCLAECRRSCCSGALVGRFSELRVLSKTRIANNPEVDPQSDGEEHTLDEIDAAMDGMLVPFIQEIDTTIRRRPLRIQHASQQSHHR